AIFFASQMPGVAFAEILILWLAIAFNILIFYWLLPLSAPLLVPYLLWVSYAAWLNLGIWRLNRQV
ncbi:MAG TPA: TspO/MBR family protein, partial [Candidatus Binatia bacterium]|nr:TspO/MBR family protein [Candidatus Binatia bacterium]